MLASLDHPHVVPIYDFVDDDGMCLLVMERLTDGTVWDRFSQTGFSPRPPAPWWSRPARASNTPTARMPAP